MQFVSTLNQQSSKESSVYHFQHYDELKTEEDVYLMAASIFDSLTLAGGNLIRQSLHNSLAMLFSSEDAYAKKVNNEKLDEDDYYEGYETETHEYSNKISTETNV